MRYLILGLLVGLYDFNKTTISNGILNYDLFRFQFDPTLTMFKK